MMRIEKYIPLLPLFFCLCCLSPSRGQGFLRKYAAGPHFSCNQLAYENGQLKFNALHSPGVYSMIFARASTNGAGELLAFDLDSLSFVYSLPHAALANGNYAYANDNDQDSVFLYELAPNNSVVRETRFAYPGSARCRVSSVRQSASGALFISGGVELDPQSNAGDYIYVIKTDTAGHVIWNTTFRGAFTPNYFFYLTSLEPCADGGVWVFYKSLGSGPDQSALVRLDANGQLVFQKFLGDSDAGWRLWGELPGGDVLFLLSNPNPQNGIPNWANTMFARFTPAGDTSWMFQPHQVFGDWRTVVEWAFPAADNGAWMYGTEQKTAASTEQFYLARFNADGSLRWKRNYAFFNAITNFPGFYSGTSLPDGGLAMGGIWQDTLTLFRCDSLGRVFANTITGTVAHDLNLNCAVDAGDSGRRGWITRATGDNGFTYYVNSDSTGSYAIGDVQQGRYAIETLVPGYLWEPCTPVVDTLVPDTGANTLNIPFPIQSVADCPLMTIDAGNAVLRPCFPAYYSIRYCNEGTQAADSVVITLLPDPLLQYDSASVAPAFTGDSLWRFVLGPLTEGECGALQVWCTVDCDSAMLGQTVCLEAAIEPDTLCGMFPGWSGATIEAGGACMGDSVRFTLRNSGSAPTTQALDFIIIDDAVVMFQGQIPVHFPPQATVIQSVAANGHTYRLQAEQEHNHPVYAQPSVAVEGCNGNPNYGLVLQFPNEDGNPFTDLVCTELTGSYDPNDKQAFPKGYGQWHWIEPNTPLEYLIRFQNTGTDTAFRVVIRDILSPWLYPASVRPGAASHPYTWMLTGDGELTFTFENILLPDSNTNEPASHGFIQFWVSQRPDNPEGIYILNQAGIYFDFNPVVRTNLVNHYIYSKFLKISAAASPPGAVAFHVFDIRPNPATDVAWLQITPALEGRLQIRLCDAAGRLVLEKSAESRSVEIRRDGLPAGVYWLEIWKNGKKLDARPLVWGPSRR